MPRLQQQRGLVAAGAVVVLGLAVCSAVIAGMTAGAAPRRAVLASLDEGEEKVRRAAGSAPSARPLRSDRARRDVRVTLANLFPCPPPPLF